MGNSAPKKDPVKILGRGKYGIASLITENGKQYVVKSIKTPTDKDRLKTQREIALLDSMKKKCNPYLLCIEDSVIEHNKTLIKLAYIPGSEEMLDFVRENHGYISTETKLHIMLILSKGLAFMHRLGIVHRDIKPANILIVPGKKEARYIDFGLSCSKKDSNCIRHLSGTPLYMAPEIIKHMKSLNYTFDMLKKSDVWSLGVTFIVLCFGSSLWFEETKKDLYAKLASSTTDSVKKQVEDIAKHHTKQTGDKDTEIFVNIISKMLTVNWKKRVSASSVVKLITKSKRPKKPVKSKN